MYIYILTPLKDLEAAGKSFGPSERAFSFPGSGSRTQLNPDTVRIQNVIKSAPEYMLLSFSLGSASEWGDTCESMLEYVPEYL